MRFSRFVESEVDFNEPIAIANTVLATLWPVVQPISVTLEMEARLREFPFIEYEIPVPISTWHLRDMEAPAHVTCYAWVKALGGHSEEAVPQLTQQALADWLACAHKQQLVEGYVPVLHITYVPYASTSSGISATLCRTAGLGIKNVCHSG